MEENFSLLLEKIKDSFNVSDLENISRELSKIKVSVLCVGSGGSSVVSQFASVILNIYNDCATSVLDPRDVAYINSKSYKNILVSSSSGTNYGVKKALECPSKKYLLSRRASKEKDVNNITYNSTYKREHSFVSLSGTLTPMAILLYYCKKDKTLDLIEKIYNKCRLLKFDLISSNDFDVISGFESSVAAKFIESTFTEAALGNVVIHNRYDFCHGRTTLPYHNKRTLIFLKTDNSSLTKLELDCAKELYTNIIVLKSRYKDPVVSNFDLTLQAMFLSKEIAHFKKKDLSKVKYSPAVKKLYYFKGDM